MGLGAPGLMLVGSLAAASSALAETEAECKARWDNLDTAKLGYVSGALAVPYLRAVQASGGLGAASSGSSAAGVGPTTGVTASGVGTSSAADTGAAAGASGDGHGNLAAAAGTNPGASTTAPGAGSATTPPEAKPSMPSSASPVASSGTSGRSDRLTEQEFMTACRNGAFRQIKG